MLETLIYIFHFHDEDKDLGTGQYQRPLVVVPILKVYHFSISQHFQNVIVYVVQAVIT